MPDDVVINFKHGRVRAVYTDDWPFADVHGCSPPVRGSNVEPIQYGPLAGYWYADMSPLGKSFQYCLYPPYARRDLALQGEREHIIERWVRGQEKEETR